VVHRSEAVTTRPHRWVVSKHQRQQRWEARRHTGMRQPLRRRVAQVVHLQFRSLSESWLSTPTSDEFFLRPPCSRDVDDEVR
jgi:hypothetical protein